LNPEGLSLSAMGTPLLYVSFLPFGPIFVGIRSFLLGISCLRFVRYRRTRLAFCNEERLFVPDIADLPVELFIALALFLGRVPPWAWSSLYLLPEAKDWRSLFYPWSWRHPFAPAPPFSTLIDLPERLPFRPGLRLHAESVFAARVKTCS